MSVEPNDMTIRRALAEESAALGDLAVRSAGYWGTDAAFLERARQHLTPPPDYISASPVYVLERMARTVGFYGIEGRGDYAELRFLFLDPAAIGQGYGKLLWNHAVRTARQLGFSRIRIESDPNAERFYQAMGAQKAGEQPTGNPDFVLGIFWYDIPAE